MLMSMCWPIVLQEYSLKCNSIPLNNVSCSVTHLRTPLWTGTSSISVLGALFFGGMWVIRRGAVLLTTLSRQ